MSCKAAESVILREVSEFGALSAFGTLSIAPERSRAKRTRSLKMNGRVNLSVVCIGKCVRVAGSRHEGTEKISYILALSVKATLNYC